MRVGIVRAPVSWRQRRTIIDKIHVLDIRAESQHICAVAVEISHRRRALPIRLPIDIHFGLVSPRAQVGIVKYDEIIVFGSTASPALYPSSSIGNFEHFLLS